jgi:hypothetical protein
LRVAFAFDTRACLALHRRADSGMDDDRRINFSWTDP